MDDEIFETNIKIKTKIIEPVQTKNLKKQILHEVKTKFIDNYYNNNSNFHINIRTYYICT